jgi:hypothetical protein
LAESSESKQMNLLSSIPIWHSMAGPHLGNTQIR